MFYSCLRSEPEGFEKYAKKYLRADKINDLRQRFPRSNYQSPAEWAEAISNEIILASLPNPMGAKDSKPSKLDKKLNEAAREWKTDQQVKGSMVFSRELLDYLDKETERLEKRIIQQTRYCTELKATEEMRNNT